MPAATIVPSAHHYENARFAMDRSIEEFNLDVSNPNIAAFIERLIDVTAHRECLISNLTKILHKEMTNVSRPE